MTLPARLFALVIFCTAALSLRLQFDAYQVLRGNPPPLATLWTLAAYFTNLTNLGVALAMMAVAMRWRITASFAAGLLVSIIMVGLVYHLILARLINPQGLRFWANQGMHTAVPVLMVGWWTAFAPKTIRTRDLPKWLIWPAAYAVYSLIRGQMTGAYPYPFLDLTSLGLPQTTLNLLGLAAAFAGFGVALIALARRLPR